MKTNLQPDSPGFDGHLLGTTLPDIIQLQCLTLSTRTVRVDANSVTGRIYFAGGQVIHAAVGVLQGEEALFEMLRWKNGAFAIEEGKHAAEETITRHWQGILLEAAQLEDEAAGPAYPSVVPPPPPSMTHHPLQELNQDPEILRFAYSDHEGTLLASKGDQSEDLQAGFAYVLQLLQLVGSSLGAESLAEVQLQGKESRALCLALEEGTFAAVTSPKASLANLSRKFA